MNLHAAAAYATHLLKARSTAGHGVHSPFMFRFITEVIGGRSDRSIIREVESLRKEMVSDRRVVQVRDLGAGSVVMGKGERSVRKIAFVAAVPKREAALLARIAGSLDKIRSGGAETDDISVDECEGVILELGTSLGISTLALALGAPHRKVISVEGSPELATIARENLLRHGAHNAEVLCMEFGEALALLNSMSTKVALAFIDGNHRGAALTEYVNRIREMGEEMIIIADDIHMNRDMICAWRSIAEWTTAPASVAGRGKQTPDLETGPASGAGPARQATTGGNVPTSGAGTAVQPSADKIAAASLETFRMGMLFCLRNLTPGRYRVRY